MSRFLLHRVAEEFGVRISFEPKPIKGEWNGAGLHTNVSTNGTRADGGMKVIEAAMKKLEARHVEHIAVYGEGNEERLTGRHETGNIDKFSYGVADRGGSIRIPRQCAKDGKGYFEDPALPPTLILTRSPVSSSRLCVVASRWIRIIWS